MSLLKNASNALGTVASVASFFSGREGGPTGKYSNFLAEVRKTSIARTTYFEVNITPPQILAGNGTARKISLFAQGSALPGYFIGGYENIKRYGYGPNHFIPRDSQNNAATITFIGDGQAEIYKFFYKWMQGIVNSDTHISSTSPNYNGLMPGQVAFKDEYASTINITVFNENHQPIIEYEMIEAFPRNLPDLQLSWSDENGIMTFPVNFEYTQARLTNAETAFNPETVKFKLSPLQKLAKISTAVTAISTLRSPRNIQDALNVARTSKNVFTGLRSSL